MKIAVVTAAFQENRPVEYLARALHKKYDVEIIGQPLLEKSFRDQKHDLYICVDGDEPLDIFTAGYLVNMLRLRRLAFWFTDFQRHKQRDLGTASMISAAGGWIFQSQLADVRACMKLGMTRCSWLPMAADPDVWRSYPEDGRAYDVSFIGNVYDPVRAGVLQQIHDSGLQFGWDTSGKADKAVSTYMLGHAKIGFNISSYHEDKHPAADLNSRVFEILACGIPIVTNDVPDLKTLSLNVEPFVRTFKKEGEALKVLKKALEDKEFLSSGSQAREWLLRNGTYELRAEQMMAALKVAGMTNQVQETA